MSTSAPKTRDEIRSKLFSQRAKSLTIELMPGLEVEVRETNVEDVLSAMGAEDAKTRMLKLMVASCYVPGTDQKLFEEGDAEALLNMPAGQAYLKLTEAMGQVSDIETMIEKEGNV